MCKKEKRERERIRTLLLTCEEVYYEEGAGSGTPSVGGRRPRY